MRVKGVPILPEVTVHALDPDTEFTEGDAVAFTLVRSGSTTDGLTVDIGLEATSTGENGIVTAEAISQTAATFAANEGTATVTVQTRNNETYSATPETVTISLTPVASATTATPRYAVGTPSTAEVRIADDDPAATVTGVAVTSTAPRYREVHGANVRDVYGAGDVIEFTVTFSDTVDVDTTNGVPTLTFSLGNADAVQTSAPYARGSGTDKLVFAHAVQAADSDSNGIFLLDDSNVTGGALQLNGGVLGAGINGVVSTAIATRGARPGHKVDGGRSGPYVESLAVTSRPQIMRAGETVADTYGAGEAIEFTLALSEAVTVTGTPHLQFSLGGTNTNAGYARGSGTDKLVFAYPVQSSDSDGDGIFVQDGEDVSGNSAVVAESGEEIDAVDDSADADLVNPGRGTRSGHRVDGSMSAFDAAAVLAIVRQDPTVSPTNADTLTWRVTFSEDVANVDPADFVLTGTTATLAVTEAAASTVFDVTASGGDLAALDGTVTLGFAPGQDITDTADTPNALADTAPTGTDERSYDLDNTAPTVTIEDVPGTSDGPFTATFAFSEAAYGFTVEDIAVGNGTASDFAGGDGERVFTARIAPAAAGEVTVDVAADAARDEAGNGNVAGEQAVSAHSPAPATVTGVAVTSTAPRYREVHGANVRDVYGAGDVIEFTVTFSDTVDVDTTSGVPTLTFGLGNADAGQTSAPYARGSGTDKLVFAHAVQAADSDSNGIFLLDDSNVTGGALQLNGGVLGAGTGGVVSTAIATRGARPGHKVDGGRSGPYVESLAVTSTPQITRAGETVADTYGAGEAIEFTLALSEAVTVTGTPHLQFSLGGTNTNAGYARGSGTDKLVFAYPVQSSDSDGDGIFVQDGEDVSGNSAVVAESGEEIDAVDDSADADLVNPGRGTRSGHRVDGSMSAFDTTAPTVLSIERHDPAGSPTNADSLTWRVTFSEDVANVDPADFVLTGTTATLAVTEAAASTVFDVTASGGDLAALDGTVTLGFAPGQDITDTAGTPNTLADTAPTGTDERGWVVDNAAPTVSIAAPDAANAPFAATFTFSEPVTGFALADIAVGNGAASDLTGGDWGTTYTATITPAAEGAVTLDVAADAAEDAAGNGNVAALRASTSADLTAPTVESVVRHDPAGSPTNADSLTWRVTFSEDVANVDNTDFTAAGTTATLAVAEATASSVFDVTASGGDLAELNGTVTLGFASGQDIADTAGNPVDHATPTGTDERGWVVDNAAPTVSIAAPDAANAPFAATFTFSEPVTGFTLADIAVGNGAASDLTGGDGGTTYTATITPAAEGAVTLDVAADAAEDAAGNGNVAAEQVSVTHDMTRPTVTITAPAAANAPFAATFTFSEPVTGFALADIAVGNGAASDLTGGDGGTTYTATITPAAEGAVTLDVAADAAEDAAGNGNVAALRASTSADLTAPTVESVVRHDPFASPTNADSLTWRVTFSEDVANVDLADFTVAGTTATLAVAEATAATVFDVTASGGDLAELNGTVTLGFATAQDIADTSTPPNALADTAPTGADERGWVVDNAAPTVSIAAPDAANAPFAATFTFSEPVTGFALGDIAVGNGAASDLTGGDGGTTYTATITPGAEGEVTLDVAADAAEDEAGNGNVAAEQASVTHDMTRPTVTITAPDAANAPFTATFTFSGPVTGFALADIAVGNGAASAFADTDGGTTYTATITPAAEGAVTLDVAADAAADAASNGNLAATRKTVDYDLTAPTVLSVERHDPAGSPTNADSLTWRVTFSEAVANVDAADFAVTGSTATVTGVQAVSGETGVHDVTVSGGNLAGFSGTVTLGFAAAQNIADEAGNALAATAPSGTDERGWVVDNTAPTVTIGDVPPTSDGPFTATFTFSEPVTGFAVEDITVGNGTASEFANTETGTTWTALITPSADGEVTVDVAADVAADEAGNGNTAAAQASSAHAAPNTPPTARDGMVTTEEDTPYPFTAGDFNFADTDAGDTLDSVTVTQLESAGDLELDGADVTLDQVIPKADIDANRLVFAPAENANGTGYATFMFRVGDGDDESASAYTMTVDVNAVNDAPAVANPIPDQTATAGAAFTFTVPDDAFEDVDGDTLEHSATQGDDTALPSWLTFTAATRTFQGTPGAGDTGTLTVKVKAEDGDGETASDQFDIVVSPPADATAPTVLSIERHDPAGSPTNADSLTWRVTFSEDVANVDNTDFTAAGTTATLAVAEATASSVFDVTASGGDLAELNGTVTLGFATAQDIADTSTPPNALADTAPTGADERGWVVDNAAPTVSIAAPDAANAPFTATFTFSEPVTGFTLADIAVGNGAASDLTGGDGGTTYTATITPAAEGAVTLDVTADVAEDAAANGNLAATRKTVDYDLTAPTVLSVERHDPAGSPTNADSLTWRVTFSEAVANVDAADFAVTGSTATVTGVQAVSGETGVHDVTVSGGNLAGFSGTVSLTLASGRDIADEAGNALAATAPSGTDERGWVVDNTAPTVTIGDVPPTSDGPFTATFTFSEPVTGFAVEDITVGNGTASEFANTETGTTWTALITPSADGEVTVDVAADVAADEAGNGNTAAAQASSAHAAPNTPPTARDGMVTTEEDTPYPFTAGDFNFADTDAGDTLDSVTVTQLESAGDLELDGADVTLDQVIPKADIDANRLVFAPAENANGTGYATFMFRVGDGDDESASAYTMTVDVNAVNDAPAVANPIPDQTATAGAAFTFTVPDDAFEDIDGDTLEHSATLANDDPLPAWLTFNAATRTFEGTPATAGTLTVKVTVEDGDGETASDQFDIVVSPPADTTAPTVLSIERHAPAGSPTNADSLTWRVTFSEDVANVDVADFAAAGTTAALAVAEATASTVFDVTASGGDLAELNGTVTLGFAAAQDIADTSTPPNALAGTAPTGADERGWVVDNAAPTVSIAAPDAANAPFTATFTFSEPVTGFTLADIAVGNGAASDLTGGDGGTTYTATITPAAEGAVTLDVTADVAEDAAANGNLAATRKTVDYDLTAPTVLSVERHDPAGSPTNADSLTWRVTFSEAVANVDAADFAVTGSTATVTGVQAVSGETGVHDVTVSGGNLAGFSGTVSLTLASGRDIADEAGNPVANATPTGIDERSYDLDNAAPTVTIAAPAEANAPFTATFTFSEPVTGFALGDIAVGNGTASDLTGGDGDTAFTATITPSAEGEVTVDVAANAAEDEAGNGSAAATQAKSTYAEPNTAPTAQDSEGTTYEDVDYAPRPTEFNFTDDDGDSLHSVIVTALPAAGKGELKIGCLNDICRTLTASDLPFSVSESSLADGDFTYVPPGNANGDAFATFRFRVSDGTDESVAEYTMTIDITPVNDAPALESPIGNQSATVDESFSFTVPDDAFGDIDGDTLAYSATKGDDTALPSWLTFTAATRTFQGTPATAGTLTVKVTVEDGGGETASDQFDIVVNEAPNEAPAFDDDELTRSVAENAGPGTNVGAPVPAATDSDGDSPTYTMEGADEASFDFDPATRQIATKAGVDYDFEAKAMYSVTITADDGKGGTDTVAVTISLTDVAEPPDAPEPPVVTATPGSTTSLDVSWTAPANDGRPEILDYDLRHCAGSPADCTADGDFTGGPQDVTGMNATIAGLDEGATYQVQVRARNDEGDGGWSESGGGSTAVPVNTPPTAVSGTVTLAEDETYAFKEADFGFEDMDAGDELDSVKITELETVGVLELNGTDVTADQVIPKADIDAGRLTFTPAENANGTGYATFMFKVSDGTAESDDAYTMTIDVTAANDAPTVASGIADQTATAGTQFTFTVPDDAFEDIDGDTLEHSATLANDDPLPAWLTFNAATRTFEGTPATAGTLTVKVTVEDGDGETASDAFDIVVSPPADTTAPRVLSIERHDPAGSPTNADALTWRVTFSEDVANVDQSDFAAAGTTATLAVAEATAATVFDVTASGGDLAEVNGTVTLGFAAAQDIADTSTPPNALADTAPTGADERGWVVDNAAPTVSIAAPDAANAPFTATFTFSEPVTGFTLADIAVGNGAASDLTGGDGGTTYTATITPAAEGAVTLDVTADVAEDAAANGNLAATRKTVDYDLTAPTVLSVERHDPAGSPTNADSLTWRVTFSEAVANVDAADFAVTGSTATVTGVQAVSGETGVHDVTVSGGNLAGFSGTVSLTLASGRDIADEAGNPVANATPTGIDERSYDLDNAAPTVTIAAPAEANAPFTATFTFSEPVTGFAVEDITVGNGTASDLTGGDGDTAYTATVTPGAEGEVTVDVAADVAADEAGNGSLAAEQVSVTYAEPNAAPTARDGMVTTEEDTPYPFTAADFRFDDTDTGDVLDSVTVTQLESAGDLEFDGADVTVGQVVPRADIDAGGLVFAPAANANGTGYATFMFRVGDGDDESASAYVMTVDVNAVNDPATGAPAITGTARVGETLTADASAIRDDADGLPALGAFAWQWLRAGDPDDAEIPGATGTTYTLAEADEGARFRVRVRFTDLDGHAEELVSEATLAVQASMSSNQPPTAVSGTVTLAEDETYAFKEADFGFDDADAGDTLASVRIVKLPGAGALTLDGAAVAEDQEVPAAELAKLVYAPPADANADGRPYASFTFRVSDGTDESADTYTMAINVTPENDAPTVANGIADQAATTGTEFTFTVPDDAFEDIDGDTLEHSATQGDDTPLPDWLTFTATNRTFTGTPTAAGTLTVRVTATDGSGASIHDDFDIAVSPPPDTTAPTVLSIERHAPAASPTNADSLTWRVTFSEDVANVDVADFTAAGTTATLAVTEATASTVFDVTASGGNLAGLNGTVTLGFAAAQDIADTSTPPNALAGTAPTGADERSWELDNAGPALLSAAVEGTTVTLLYDEPLDAGSVPAAGDYSVSVDGTAAAPSAVALTGSQVALTLGAAPAGDVAVTVSYTVPATNPVRDRLGNEAGALSAQPVTRSLIRLAGGAGDHEGRVEVFRAGQWGTVCDDYWDNRDADVACRMAGHEAGSVEDAGRFRRAHFGEGSLSRIWLDNLRCTGDEESLFDCPRARGIAVGEHNCRPSENVGVRCLVTGGTAPPRVTGIELNAPPGDSWSAGETVEVTLAWSEDVTVATPAGGEPPKLWIGFSDTAHPHGSGVVRHAVYASGSGTARTVFRYTLKAGYRPSDLTGATGDAWRPGLAPDYESVEVYRNSLRLRGGTIVSASGVPAELGHRGHPEAMSQLEGPRVAAAPTISGAGPDGRWTPGETVEVGLPFDRQVLVTTTGGTPSVEIGFLDGRKRRAAYTFGSTTHELIFAYTLTGADEGQTAILVTPDSLAPGGGLIRGWPDLEPAALGHGGSARQAGPAHVAPAGPTASFSGVPDEHDGRSAFTLGFTMSEAPEPGFSFRTVRDHLFEVTGGRITLARRAPPGQDRAWTLTVFPGGTGAITVRMRETRSCDASPRVCTADGRPLAGEVVATVPGPARLSVADAQVREGAGPLEFAVTLSRARTEPSTVRYATADGTATAGEDYAGTSGTLAFEAGVTERTVSVPVLDDAHDEGTETLTLTLSDPAPAGHVRIADGTATGTIANTDPVPRAWTVRFGRTVAEQAVDAVRDRLGADRSPGFRGRLAGRPLPDGTGTAGEAADADAAEDDPLAVPALAEDGRRAFMALLALETGERRDAESGSGPESSAVSADDALLGTSFELVQETGDGLSLGLWGRVARSGFTGRDGDLSLDGEATAAMLGTDWPRRDALFGLMLFRSRGAGGYDAPEGGGRIEAELSGLVPWAGRRKDGTPTFWGAAGTGRGEMTLTPGGGDPVTAGLGWSMAAAGAEGAPVTADALGGAQVGWRADALWTRTASEAAAGLAAGSGTTSRLRLGLEATWTRALASGATLSPRLEAGLRHDGGDAETGFGLETGGGVRFEDSARGLSVALDGRALMLHEDGDFEDWGLAVTVGWDPRPETRLGPSVIATRGWGGASSGGVSALLDPATVPGPGGADGGARLDLEAAWGTDLSGWRHGMVGSAYGRVAGSPDVEDLRLGWRVGPDAGHDAGLDRDFWLEPGLGGSAVIGAGLNRSRERTGTRSSTGVSLAASDGGLEAGFDMAWEW